jgi:hypothetical protein
VERGRTREVESHVWTVIKMTYSENWYLIGQGGKVELEVAIGFPAGGLEL